MLDETTPKSVTTNPVTFDDPVTDGVESEIQEDGKTTVHNIYVDEKAVALMADPEKVVQAEISKRVTQKLKNGTIDEKFDQKADEVIDRTFNSIEKKGNVGANKDDKEEAETFFELHKNELATGGITKVVDIKKMKRVVRTSKFWYNVWYVLVIWWIIGINTFYEHVKPLKTSMRVVSIIASIIISLAIFTAIGFGLYYGISFLSSLN